MISAVFRSSHRSGGRPAPRGPAHAHHGERQRDKRRRGEPHAANMRAVGAKRRELGAFPCKRMYSRPRTIKRACALPNRQILRHLRRSGIASGTGRQQFLQCARQPVAGQPRRAGEPPPVDGLRRLNRKRRSVVRLRRSPSCSFASRPMCCRSRSGTLFCELAGRASTPP